MYKIPKKFFFENHNKYKGKVQMKSYRDQIILII